MKTLRVIFLGLILVAIISAQELKEKDNNLDRSGKNSSIGLKKQIPNYDRSIKKSATIKKYSTGSMENSGNAHNTIVERKNGISYSVDEVQQTFHECKE